MIRIGVVLSPIAYERLMQMNLVFEDDVKLIHYIYKDLSDVENWCFENLDKLDVFIFGGWFPIRMIKDKSLFEKIPCINFPMTAHDELYKLLLKLSIENGGLDLSRTYIDCIDENNDFMELKEVIPKDRFPYAYTFPYDENFHKKLLETHRRLWNEGKIDISITRFGSAVPELQKLGVKIYYLFPSRESIINTFNTAINQIKIKELQNSQIAIGHITIPKVYTPLINFDYDFEMKQTTLYQAIMNFVIEHQISNVIQKYSTSYEVLISRGALKKITGNYSYCLLLQYLQKSVPFKVSIGWGLGADLRTARQNAKYANIESERTGGDCSFVKTDQNNVIGPLAAQNCLTYKNTNRPQIAEIGKKTKLSPVTIQKLIGVMEQLNSSELSASDIAYYLGITERSANRIISKLELGEFAVELYTKSEKLKGRPKKIYSFKLPLKSDLDTDPVL